MNRYVASLRIKGSSVQTMVFADSQLHARLILQYQFGMNSLQSAPIQVNEAEIIKPLTPEQVKIKTMQDRVKKDKAVLKAERARQKIHRAQQQITKAINLKKPL